MSTFLSSFTRKRRHSPSILDSIGVKRSFIEKDSKSFLNSNEKSMESFSLKTELAKLRIILNSTETDLMSSKVEFEKTITALKIENQALAEKVESAKDQLNRTRVSMDTIQSELNESREETTSARLNSSTINYSEMSQREDELIQQLDDKTNRLESLERKLLNQQNEYNMLNNKFRETETTLQLRTKTLEDYKSYLKEKKEQLEQHGELILKIEKLEREIKDFSEDKLYVECMKQKLVDYPELKEKNQTISRENKRLKSIHKNIHLLEQENMEYKKKEAEFKSATTKCHELQLVNQELKQKLELWETKIPNPNDVIYNLSRIQRENLILSQSEAAAKKQFLSIHQNLQLKSQQVDSLQLKLDNHKELIGSLQKTNKMLSANLELLQRERNDYKDLLDAYLARQCLDEVQLNSTNPLAKRCALAEKGLSERTEFCRQQRENTTRLEEENRKLMEQLDKMTANQNKSSVFQSSNPIPASPESKVTVELRSRMVEYEAQLQQLRTKLLLLEKKPVMVDTSSLIQPTTGTKDCQVSLMENANSSVQITSDHLTSNPSLSQDMVSPSSVDDNQEQEDHHTPSRSDCEPMETIESTPAVVNVTVDVGSPLKEVEEATVSPNAEPPQRDLSSPSFNDAAQSGDPGDEESPISAPDDENEESVNSQSPLIIESYEKSDPESPQQITSHEEEPEFCEIDVAGDDPGRAGGADDLVRNEVTAGVLQSQPSTVNDTEEPFYNEEEKEKDESISDEEELSQYFENEMEENSSDGGAESELNIVEISSSNESEGGEGSIDSEEFGDDGECYNEEEEDS